MTRDINKKEFGLRLAQKRDLMGLSQTELGKELNPEKADNLGQQTISKFETGKQYPTYDELLSLSKALETTVDYLAYGEPSENKRNNIPEVEKIDDLGKIQLKIIYRIKKIYGCRNDGELCKILKVSKQIVSNYKKGSSKIPISMLLKIVQDKQTSLDWLLTGKARIKDFGETNEKMEAHIKRLETHIERLEKHIERLEARLNL